MICLKCNQTFKSSQIVDGKRRNLSARKYCLDCSPFNSFNRKKLHSSDLQENHIIDDEGHKKYCKACDTTKPIEVFYQNKNKIHSYCKTCQNILTGHRLKLFKLKCVEYKGGSCEKCGYNKSPAALDFHHKSSFDKEFEISKVKNRSFNETITQELDKCSLLCSNCHREEHELPLNIKAIEFLNRKKITLQKPTKQKFKCLKCFKELENKCKFCDKCRTIHMQEISKKKLTLSETELLDLVNIKTVMEIAVIFDVNPRSVYKRITKAKLAQTS